MTYDAPLNAITFAIDTHCPQSALQGLAPFRDFAPEMAAPVLQEAARFAQEILAPLNRSGDLQGSRCTDGQVTTPDGWKAAYDAVVASGWNSPAAPEEYGGMGLPSVLNAAVQEMFHGANMAFQLCPMLTQGAIEAIAQFAAPALRKLFLAPLISGVWSGTMNLTEPQAGSDLAAVRSRALPEGDHYRIRGQKIFITYGEHDLTENIIHLVLARLQDAPEGVKGISLFIVPKLLVSANGALCEKNDIHCVSIEHKLGIHASPTCTLSFGDQGGAIGYLVGEPHRGLEYMFAMMNNARLNVGLQGVAIAERAVQQATLYAGERTQGRTVTGDKAIIGHSDIRRMLAEMRARTEASRVICYRAAQALDLARHSDSGEERARHQRRADLLIPVAKGWSTENAVLTTSLNVQVHGGLGYIEETGAAQGLRDARITTIYEGTTAIQALDLIGRKILRDKGLALTELIDEIAAIGPDDSVEAGMLRTEAAALLTSMREWLLAQEAPVALEVSNSVLELTGLCLAAWGMAGNLTAAKALLATNQSNSFARTRIAIAQFFAARLFPQARAALMIAISESHRFSDLTPDLLRDLS